jgi:hypothetical protein
LPDSRDKGWNPDSFDEIEVGRIPTKVIEICPFVPESSKEWPEANRFGRNPAVLVAGIWAGQIPAKVTGIRRQ